MTRTVQERIAGARIAGDLAVARGWWTEEQRADLEAELRVEERRAAALTATPNHGRNAT